MLSFINRTISNDVPLSPIADPPTYETIPGTYEEIAAVNTTPTVTKATPTVDKSGYDYTVNEAYSTVTN